MSNMISEVELKKLIKEEERYVAKDREDRTYHNGRVCALREVLNGNNEYSKKYRLQD